MKPLKTHCHKNLKIAITGGIGSGKSFVCKKIEAAGYPIFYCDEEAKIIIRENPKVVAALKELIGDHVYNTAGMLNKDIMRNYLCAHDTNATKVDAIVHPQVAEAFRKWAAMQTSDKVFMECALLFESGFNHLVDRVILVTAPSAIRIARVMKRDSIPQEKVLQIMALQMSEDEKAKHADVVINNDGQEDVTLQIHQILEDSQKTEV